jgi:hypothetical protein
VRYSRRSLARSRIKLPPDGQLKTFERNLFRTGSGFRLACHGRMIETSICLLRCMSLQLARLGHLNRLT